MYGKSGNSGENSNGSVHPGGNFPAKKQYHLSRYYLCPVLTETTEIFCIICLDYQCQASCREKVKNAPVFCKWYNSIPLLFSVPKKFQYHLTGNSHRNFRTNGKRSQSCFFKVNLPKEDQFTGLYTIKMGLFHNPKI